MPQVSIIAYLLYMTSNNSEVTQKSSLDVYSEITGRSNFPYSVEDPVHELCVG